MTPINAGLIADIDTACVRFGKALLSDARFNSEVYGAANYNYPYYIYDVTAGSNGCYAGTGFELITPLSVPNGEAIGGRLLGIP